MRVNTWGADEADSAVRELLATASIRVCSISDEIASMAIDAYGRFGKGRHPAALNLGDWFAYACAKSFQVPLLYKGDDFARTDLSSPPA